MTQCQIIASPRVHHEIIMALQVLRPFIPRSLATLFVEPLEQGDEEEQHLAQYRQSSGYREATLFISPVLVEETGPSILQVLRHELVHAHLHQLDVFVHALIATCPGNRSRKAVEEVYCMLRESVCDDISYALGDVVEKEREGQKMACLFKMADDMVDRLKAEERRGQAIW